MPEPTLESIGPLRVHAPDVDRAIDVTVDGAPESIALEIPWGPIIDLGIAVGKKLFGGNGGGGGGAKGCVTVNTTIRRKHRLIQVVPATGVASEAKGYLLQFSTITAELDH